MRVLAGMYLYYEGRVMSQWLPLSDPPGNPFGPSHEVSHKMIGRLATGESCGNGEDAGDGCWKLNERDYFHLH